MSKNTSTEIIEHNGKQLKEKYGVEVYQLLHGLLCTKLDKQQGYFLLTLMDELLKAKWLGKPPISRGQLERRTFIFYDLEIIK